MKLLMVLMIFTGFNTWAQIDYPTRISTPNEWAHYAWAKYHSDSLRADEYQLILNEVNNFEISNLNRLKLFILSSKFGMNIRSFYFDNSAYADEEVITFLAIHENYLKLFDRDDRLLKLIKKKQVLHQKINSERALSKIDIRKTIKYDSSISSYHSGKYDRTVRLYLICRENRSYPCLFILKDKYGDFVRTENGKLWSLAALAKSKRNIDYNKTNGHTPTGIHRMDSVMPEANRQGAFGKFRRVILNWIGGQNDESGSLSFLPKSQHSKSWWKKATIARDAGRKYLRIHGTGRINHDPNSLFYPHIPTSGCISTLEGHYSGVEYIGQRKILDKLLKASQLAPVYSNEVKISGILYVLELGNKKAAVKLSDLEDIGIK